MKLVFCAEKMLKLRANPEEFDTSVTHESGENMIPKEER